MVRIRQVIAVILTVVMALSSGAIAFAEEPSAAGADEETAAALQEQEADAEVTEVLPEDVAAEASPEAADELVEAETPVEELPEATEPKQPETVQPETIEEPLQEADTGADIDIVRTDSPIQAGQEAPAADNEAFYTIDLGNGKVTDSNEDTVANGFAEIYGEKYSETGLKEMSDSQREEQIEEMTAETELYSVAGTDGDTAEVISKFATCRLIVDEEAAGDEFDSFGALRGTAYEGMLLLTYENEEATAKAYRGLCECYGKENVLIDLPAKSMSTDMASFYWNTKNMGFKNVAPAIKTYGDNVTVAVLDSGINRSHILIDDGRTIYKGYDFVNRDKNPADDNGHGTAVTSIITQCTESNIRILPIKVLDSSGGGNLVNMLLGLEYAREQGADVVNMSLGMNLRLSYYEEDAKAFIAKADTYLKKFRGPIIAAAGNDGDDMDWLMMWPAVSKQTIAVSALTEGSTGNNGVFDSNYSNYGDSVDFAAPGTKINVAVHNSGTASVMYGSDGTSFAAPHITAAAALLMANKSSLSTKVQVKTALGLLCRDMGPAGKDPEYGNGCPVFTGSNLVIDKSVRSISKASVKIAAKKTYTGKGLKPVPTVKYGRAKLIQNKNYTVRYYSNKSVGKAKVVITGKGIRHSGKKTVYFKINPRGTKLTKYKPAKKTMTVYWSKQAKKMSKARITGYQIQLATNTKFTKNKKTVTVKGYKKTKKKIKKLKRKTRYYARIRTYMKTKTGTYYSPWSSTVYGYSN